ncbi:aspartyl protease family protein [Shewanella sp. 10N.7]|uniref:aspartyl protease family protein n=1 Tax=Shewanella sp. 10N.7 TaxID=2885093 RepID=UPI001E2DBDF2|nr:aspartyl protease family protein [Shewanella sp. 10N.7]MCC4834882.1 aspartyl protease family protein [Shewanella sp. 10N.7]
MGYSSITNTSSVVKIPFVIKISAILLSLFFYTATVWATQIQQNLPLVESEDGQLHLDVMIQALSGRMIIDTGSSSSVLDRRYLSSIDDYTSLDVEKGYGFGSEQAMMVSEKIQLSGFTVSGYELSSINLNTHNLSGINRKYLGLLGFDLLQLIAKGLQFSELQTQLLAQYTLDETKNNLSLFSSGFGIPYVVVNINEQEVGLILDTGSQYSIINRKNAVDLSISSELIPNAYGQDINGKQIPISMSDSIAVSNGKASLFENRFIVTDLDSVIVNDSFNHQVIGIIGLNQLKSLNTKIGFESNTVTFQ